jgi:hypothetical protein
MGKALAGACANTAVDSTSVTNKMVPGRIVILL